MSVKFVKGLYLMMNLCNEYSEVTVIKCWNLFVFAGNKHIVRKKWFLHLRMCYVCSIIGDTINSVSHKPFI